MHRRERFFYAYRILFVLVLAVCTPGVAAAGKPGKIPGKRLSKGVYTSPEGAFTVAIDSLGLIGMRIEEGAPSPGSTGVFLADDFGKTFAVVRSDTSDSARTVEQLSERYHLGDVVRAKDLVMTERGTELRIIVFNPGGSPIVTRTQVDKKMVERNNDLYEAGSVFIAHGAIYRASAGVSPLADQPGEDEMFRRARLQLGHLLNALAIASSPH